MDDTHLLSVILPVYNSESYLDNCLSSVLGQEGVALEVIAVDDGSTDLSPSILRRFAQQDRRLVVLTVPNGGVNQARNLALDCAKGEYIAFCDSDDTVPAGAYQKLMQTAVDGGYDVVIGGHFVRSDDGVNIAVSPQTNQSSPMGAFMQSGTLWERIVRRDLLERGKIRFENYLGGGDTFFVAMTYPMNPRTAFLSESIYHYWNHTHDATPSIANTRDFAHFSDRLRCARDIIERVPPAMRQEAEEYVYLKQGSYFRSVLLRLSRGDELEQGLLLFRKFLSRFDWERYPEEFQQVVGTDHGTFEALTGLDYLRLVGAGGLLPPKELVLRQFQEGDMGMRYLLAYGRAWLRYKSKNRFRRRPL